MLPKRFIIRLASLLCVSTGLAISSPAPLIAAYPDKPVTIIVPFGAGGAFDALARGLGARLEKELGVPFVVKIEEGAGGRRGGISLFKSKPDGHTIGFSHIIPFLSDDFLLGKKPPVDYRKFAVILKIADSNHFLYVSKNSPLKSLADLKNAGRPIKFAGTGLGAITWVEASATGSQVGFPTTFVMGYKNLPEAALAVARGDAEAGAGGWAHIKGVVDDLRPLAYLGAKREPHLPDIPSIVELGYPKLANLGSPRLLSAPPGTSEEQLEVLRKALRKIAAQPDFIKWTEENGFPLDIDGPKETWQGLDDLAEILRGLKPMFDKAKAQ